MKATLSSLIAMALALSTANAAPAPPLNAPPYVAHKDSETRSSDIDWDALASQWQKDAAKSWSRLWGGAMSPLAVILTDRVGQARLITKEESRVIQVEDLLKHQIPLPDGRLTFGRWDDKLAVAADATVQDLDYLFAFVIHEAFHQHVQYNPDTRWPEANVDRPEQFSDYPLQVDPRLVRRMLQHSLLQAYVDVANRPLHLAAAAWWHQAWLSDFTDESERARQGDVIEGTAQYVQMLGTAMPDIDDPDSLQQRHAYFVKSLRPLEGCRDTSTEHYEIGSIAGLLLDDMRVDWMKRAETGQTPAKLVLEGIAPSSGEVAPEHIRSTIVACIQELAAQVAPLVDKSLDDMRRPASATLEIPYGQDHVESTFDPATDVFRADGIPYSFSGISKGLFTTPTGAVTATNTALFLGADGYLLSLNPAEFKVVGRRLTLNGPVLSGSLAVEAISDPDGRIRYRAIGSR